MAVEDSPRLAAARQPLADVDGAAGLLRGSSPQRTRSSSIPEEIYQIYQMLSPNRTGLGRGAVTWSPGGQGLGLLLSEGAGTAAEDVCDASGAGAAGLVLVASALGSAFGQELARLTPEALLEIAVRYFPDVRIWGMRPVEQMRNLLVPVDLDISVATACELLELPSPELLGALCRHLALRSAARHAAIATGSLQAMPAPRIFLRMDTPALCSIVLRSLESSDFTARAAARLAEVRGAVAQRLFDGDVETLFDGGNATDCVCPAAVQREALGVRSEPSGREAEPGATAAGAYAALETRLHTQLLTLSWGSLHKLSRAFFPEEAHQPLSAAQMIRRLLAPLETVVPASAARDLASKAGAPLLDGFCRWLAADLRRRAPLSEAVAQLSQRELQGVLRGIGLGCRSGSCRACSGSRRRLIAAILTGVASNAARQRKLLRLLRLKGVAGVRVPERCPPSIDGRARLFAAPRDEPSVAPAVW